LKVSLLVTAECGLCGRAEVMLRRYQKLIHFEFDLVDIGEDDDLFRKYWDRVPVVLVDGVEAAAAPIDEKRLAAMLGA
jgi:hypothetical protein